MQIKFPYLDLWLCLKSIGMDHVEVNCIIKGQFNKEIIGMSWTFSYNFFVIKNNFEPQHDGIIYKSVL